jgi:AraC family transcriptional regulator of adaptative response/methylated-DNA-[protein]-cysteine methyltransferase
MWKENCWSAVAGRNSEADGDFVYGVRSTRIFCCPSCPSRPGGPDRITLFLTPDDAAKAGFRACKRCKPETRFYQAKSVAGSADLA